MKRILPEVDIAVYGVQVNQRPTSGLHHGGSQYVHEALSFDGEEVEGFFFFFVAQIPGTEGRCGMAAIEDRDGSVDQGALDTLSEGLKRSVPSYARPLFLRIMKKIPVNGTYKVTKNVLQKESYNIMKIQADPIYFLDLKSGRYVPLTESIFNDLNEGRIRV